MAIPVINARHIAAGMVSLWLTSGCATNQFVFDNPFYQEQETPAPSQPPVVPVNLADSGLSYRPDSRDASYAEANVAKTQTYHSSLPNAYVPMHTHKSLSQYAEQLSMMLIERAKWLNIDSTVGVASFVTLDDTLQNSTVLGNQLSEYCIAEIQAFGVSVVDFKVADSLSVGQTGDFVFSRNNRKLAKKLALDYVMSGTMITTDTGVRVNARIIALDSRIVVASASVLIPHFIAQQLVPESTFITATAG